MTDENKKEVFISYSTKDIELVEKICKDLEIKGINLWRDKSGIEMGEEWQKSISTAIRNCQIAILFLSKNSNDSRQVRREISLVDNFDKLIIPVKIDSQDLYEDLQFILAATEIVVYNPDTHDNFILALVARIKKIINEEKIDDVNNFNPEKMDDEDVLFASNIAFAGHEYKLLLKGYSYLYDKGKLDDFTAQYNFVEQYLKFLGVEKSKENAEKGGELLVEFAEKGNPDANFQLGIIAYESDKEDTENYLSFFQDAAATNQGKFLGNAQYMIAKAYFDGKGYEQNHNLAFIWFHKALENGVSDAQKGIDSLQAFAPYDFEFYDKYEKSEKGDAEAQYRLGDYLVNGQRCEKDEKEGMKWFKESANQGNSWGALYLGWALHNGRAGNKDDKEAIYWLYKSVEVNADKSAVGQAFLELGLIYLGDEDAPSLEYKDLAKAEDSFIRAIKLGEPLSAGYLATYLLDGKIGRTSKNEAFFWFKKAQELGNEDAVKTLRSVFSEFSNAFYQTYLKAESGNADAQNSLGVDIYNRTGCEKNIIEGVQWMKKAAEQNNPWGMTNYASHLQNGDGIEQDKAAAINWFEKAAETEFMPAKAASENSLGVTYLEGKGVDKDFSRAEDLLLKAYEHDNYYGAWNLSRLYSNENFENHSKNKAFYWIRKAKDMGYTGASKSNKEVYQKRIEEIFTSFSDDFYQMYLKAEQGDSNSQNTLGAMILDGTGCEKNIPECIYWYEKAAAQGNLDAQHNIAVLQFQGIGYDRNEQKAADKLKELANKGHEQSKRDLPGIYRKAYGFIKTMRDL